jgi:methyltransferase (TIGR00027 family)
VDLSQVSRTAILTLITRVVAAEKRPAEFADPMAAVCLERLIQLASAEEKEWILGRRRFYCRISAHDAFAGARRSKVFDAAAGRYIASHPGCSVVNLGCGFDTRFWRLDREHCRYFEVDLPPVIALKKEALQDPIGYETIGCSLTDPDWIEPIVRHGRGQVLFLAEGVLMFLPRPELAAFLQRLAERFVRSQLVFDMVEEKYLHGLWKQLVRLETRINWKLQADWQTGLRAPAEIESLAPGLTLLQMEKGSAGPVLTAAIHPD